MVVKCVIICRVSTYIQSTKYSLDTQENYLQEYADRYKYKVEKYIREVGSVWRKKSKINVKFLKLIKDTSGTKFLLLDVSRLCRCPKLVNKILSLLKKNNNEIIFVSQGIHVPRMRKKFKSYLNQAHLESKRISNRVIMAKAYMKKKSLYLGGPIKYGYSKKFIKKSRRNIIVKNNNERKIMSFINACKKTDLTHNEMMCEINILRKHFKKSCTISVTTCKKITYRIIADILNSCKIHCRGKRWTAARVSNIYRTTRRV